MKTRLLKSTTVLIVSLTINALAMVRYVNVNNPSPVSPYTNWAKAAVTIQDAIKVAADGDQILVTNGVYQTGGTVVYGSLSNRVAVTRVVTVKSVNGPAVTVIKGNPVIGDNAVRCVYLTNNAVLTGFTLTNGATRTDGDGEQGGGGVWCEDSSAVVSNCVLTANLANDTGGGAYQGTLNNCVLSSNSTVNSGGGAEGCTLNSCTLTGNSANNGGGADASTLTNCTLTGNSAVPSDSGGGGGGGAENSTLNNCTLTGNSGNYGGGADASTLNNCALAGNSAVASSHGDSYGGGAENSTLNNCTLTGNSANNGGGADNSTLNNCIVYFNNAPNGANCSSSGLNYCCAIPLPDGDGNIASDPQLADFAHLSGGSPCRGAGSEDYVTGVDIDGEAWANPPAIGCDEYHAGAITGSLSVAITADYTNVAKGFAANLTGLITGHASSNVWNFKDGTMASNEPYASHSWAAAGDYAVVFTAFNTSNPGGVSATQTVHVSDGNYYVAQANHNPVAPFDSWTKAATNIQDAVDAAFIGGTIWVSNGVYQTGGRDVSGDSNRVAVTRQLTMASVNGPAVTLINGAQAARCVYLCNGSVLTGFTLTNGNISENGGGAYCESAGATDVQLCFDWQPGGQLWWRGLPGHVEQLHAERQLCPYMAAAPAPTLQHAPSTIACFPATRPPIIPFRVLAAAGPTPAP